MSQTTAQPWEAKRTDETRHVERFLEEAGFHRVDAYRFNSVSIRIRVIDPRFEGLSDEKRDAMVEPFLDALPGSTQEDILFLLTLAPSELPEAVTVAARDAKPRTLRKLLVNAEFVEPSPSTL